MAKNDDEADCAVSISRRYPVTDLELHQALIQGDERVLALIVERYSVMVLVWLRRDLPSLARNESLEELAGDVFLSMWRNARSFNPKSCSFRSWLRSLTRKTARQYARDSIPCMRSWQRAHLPYIECS